MQNLAIQSNFREIRKRSSYRCTIDYRSTFYKKFTYILSKFIRKRKIITESKLCTNFCHSSKYVSRIRVIYQRLTLHFENSFLNYINTAYFMYYYFKCCTFCLRKMQLNPFKMPTVNMRSCLMHGFFVES